MLQRILVLLILTSMVYSCRSTKTIQTAISKKDTVVVVTKPIEDPHADSIRFMQSAFDSISKNHIDFNTFSAKIKVDFEGKEGKKNDFNAFIRMKKDSALWVSINAAMGIEAFRILITPDSVKVLNKFDKVVILRSVEYLQEVTHLPFTFTELQNVIVGNPVYLDTNMISYEKEEKQLTLMQLNNFFKHMLTVSLDDYSIQNSKLDDVDLTKARTCLVVYGNYENKNNRKFSAYRKITVTEKNKLDIELDYKQYDFNVELSYPFSIPKNYKKQ